MGKIGLRTLIAVGLLVILLPFIILEIFTERKTYFPYFGTLHVLADVNLRCYLHYANDYPGQLPAAEFLVSTMEDRDITLNIAQEQPLKEFGVVTLVDSRKLGKYLYTNKVPDSNIPENYVYIYACCAAVKEKPKGKYWAYKIKNFFDYWVLLGLETNEPDMDTWIIRSNIPPIPGCYLTGDGHVYYPDSVVPALRAYYPNIEIRKQQLLKVEVVYKGGHKIGD